MQQISPQYKRQNFTHLQKISNNAAHLSHQSLIKNIKKLDTDSIFKNTAINNDCKVPQSYRYQKSTFSSPKICQKQQQVNSPIPNSYKTPKIIFSYNRKRAQNQERIVKYIPGSCRQIFKDYPIDQCQIQQFQIASKHVTKLQKRLKLSLQSCVLYHSYKPPSQNTNRALVQSKQEENHNGLKNNYSDNKIGETSKIASTQANSSGFGSQYLPNLEVQKQKIILTFDQKKRLRKQQKSLSLLDRVSPSKLLKKTIILSKYDFGGMFNGQNSKVKYQNTQKRESSSNNNNKWQNCVKCLFDSDQNLKESIHYGPDIRQKQDTPNNYLAGFGRQIEASCIPEHD